MGDFRNAGLILTAGFTLACGARDSLVEATSEIDESTPAPEPPQLLPCLESGSWQPVTALVVPRAVPAVAPVGDGDAIVSGGITEGPTDVVVVGSIERYDSMTQSFTIVAELTAPRARHAVVTLADGKLLFTGGYTAFGPDTALATTEIFDPSTNVVSVASDMPIARSGHSMGRLPDGRVLVVGGIDGMGFAVPTAALFDQELGVWSSLEAPINVAGGWNALIENDHGAFVLAYDGIYDFDGVTFEKLPWHDGQPPLHVPHAHRYRDGFASVDYYGNVFAFADGDFHSTQLWTMEDDSPSASLVLPLCDSFLVLVDRSYEVRFEPAPVEVTSEDMPTLQPAGVRLSNGELLHVGGYATGGIPASDAAVFR